MNRNLQGVELNREELKALCFVKCKDGTVGMTPEQFLTEMKNSALWEASRKARFEAFWRGELVLDTRPSERPAKPVEVDWEVVNWLRGV